MTTTNSRSAQMQDYPRPHTEGAYTALGKLNHRGGLYRDPGESTIPPPTTLVSAHGISHQKSNGFCIPVGHWPGSIPSNISVASHIPGRGLHQGVIWARAHGLHTIIDPHGVHG